MNSSPHHFFHHHPHFHPHYHGPHMFFPHLPHWHPHFDPHSFQHQWPHFFPPFIPPYHHYQPFHENNRNFNNNNNSDKEKEKYIPKDDDYDYMELYDFNNNKKGEINAEEINIIKENNSDVKLDFKSKNFEIEKEEDGQANNINNGNDYQKQGYEKQENNMNIFGGGDNKSQNQENKDDSINNFGDSIFKGSSIKDNNINNFENNQNINIDKKEYDKNNSEYNQIKDSESNNDFFLLTSFQFGDNIEINDINLTVNNNVINNNDKQVIIESNHEHPLNYIDDLKLKCTICQQINKDKPGYKCEQCPVVLCLNCAERVFYGNKKISIHPHPLLLQFKNEWKCNICEIVFKNHSTFSCGQCGFNVCTFCLIP